MNNLIPGTNEYIDALADSRFEDAKRHLLVAIASVKERGESPVLAGLAQRLGSILLKQGDKLGALGLYEISECLDSESLLTKLDYAKFLMFEMGDTAAAGAKCQGIIASATAKPFPGSDEDFSSEEYAEAAGRLLRESTA